MASPAPEYTFLPKVAGYQIIRSTVVDARNRPIPLTMAGEWHASFSNLFVTGMKVLLTNRVNMVHIDLTELVKLTEPGQYLVFPRILFYPESNNPDLPSTTELRAIPFEVIATRFERPTNASASVFASAYQQHLDKLAGRSLPLTDLEKELAAQSQQGLKEALEQHRQFMEAQARDAAATNPPAAPPAVAAPDLRAETDEAPRRQLGWPLLAAGAALLAILWCFWRQRGN